MFGKASREGYRELLEGVRIKTLVHGEHTTMAEFRMRAGARLPLHSHVHEQTGYLVSGCFRLSVEGRSRLLRPGDSWCVPSHVPHEAEVLEDCLLMEVFSPRREEYLAYARAEDLED